MSDIGHVVRLLYGDDPADPVRTLDMAAGGAGIYLRESGLSPGPGQETILWAGGGTLRNGQRRIGSSRANAEFDLAYDLSGASAMRLSGLQSKVNRFANDIKLRHEQRKAQKVWVEYRWADGLRLLPTPVFGQLSHFMEVHAILLRSWPQGLHTGALTTGNIEDMVITLVCDPLPSGLPQLAGTAINWDGGLATISDQDDGVLLGDDDAGLLWILTSEMAAEFTAEGWVTPQWDYDDASADVTMLGYVVDGDNFVAVYWDYDDHYFKFAGELANVPFSDTGSARTFSDGDPLHLALVQGASTLKLYVNGVEDCSASVAAGLGAGGYFYLGAGDAGEGESDGTVYDGWRIFDDDLTAAQALAVYNNESPVKADDLAVCPVPWLMAPVADGVSVVFNHCDSDSGHQNWFEMGGIPGDTEADVEWRIQPPTSGASLTYWLARLAVDDELSDPGDDFYVELDGTADANTSSNDAYKTANLAAPGSEDESASLDDAPVQHGRFEFVARMQVLKALTATPFYQFSSTWRVEGVAKSLAVDASALRLRALGDLWIDWPGDDPTAITAGANLAYAGTGNIAYIDLVQLLPYPLCRVTVSAGSLSVSSGDVLRITGEGAWMEDDDGVLLYSFDHEGDAVGIEPHRYNYVWLVQCGEGEVWDITLAAIVNAVVTPHWLLPGGTVG